MIFETWMTQRKMVLLTEKKEQLFAQIARAPDFHMTRANLHHTLSRIHAHKNLFASTVNNPTNHPMNALNIPFVA